MLQTTHYLYILWLHHLTITSVSSYSIALIILPSQPVRHLYEVVLMQWRLYLVLFQEVDTAVGYLSAGSLNTLQFQCWHGSLLHGLPQSSTYPEECNETMHLQKTIIRDYKLNKIPSSNSSSFEFDFSWFLLLALNADKDHHYTYMFHWWHGIPATTRYLTHGYPSDIVALVTWADSPVLLCYVTNACNI